MYMLILFVVMYLFDVSTSDILKGMGWDGMGLDGLDGMVIGLLKALSTAYYPIRSSQKPMNKRKEPLNS